ncbi:MAG: pyridoxal phosphate-dependent aminotransferase [Pseudomonadota bacterium]
MQMSRRILGVGGDGSDAWDVYERARERQAAGKPVVMLTIGDHDRTTPRPILDAMHRSAVGGNTGYAAMRGSASLRAAIARRAAERTGIAVAPEQVVVTAGGQAALFAAFIATLDPGDAAIIVDPYYATYPLTVRAASGRVLTVAARPETGFQIDLEDLAAKAAEARVLLINTPNNPTGAVYSERTLAGVAEIAQRHDLWLISDEVYDVQVHDGVHLSAAAFPGMAERTLVIGSMSKSHMMTGSRLGWMIAPLPVAEQIGDLAIATTYGVPGFIQDAAEYALAEQSALEDEVAELYARRRQVALAALAGSNGLSLTPPAGGMYVMADIRGTGLTGKAFAHLLLEEEGIAVLPGEGFGAAAAGHVRIALTVAEDVLQDALRRLARFADRLARGAA